MSSVASTWSSPSWVFVIDVSPKEDAESAEVSVWSTPSRVSVSVVSPKLDARNRIERTRGTPEASSTQSWRLSSYRSPGDGPRSGGSRFFPRSTKGLTSSSQGLGDFTSTCFAQEGSPLYGYMGLGGHFAEWLSRASLGVAPISTTELRLATRLSLIGRSAAMAGLGHKDQFSPPRQSGRCGVRKRSFAADD